VVRPTFEDILGGVFLVSLGWWRGERLWWVDGGEDVGLRLGGFDDAGVGLMNPGLGFACES
jgi:hypothetical protein